MPDTSLSTATLPRELRTYLTARLAGGQLEMPLLPNVAGQVAQLCQSEHADAAQISALVHKDQALAAHLLRVSNSALYAASNPIVSLQQAISRLGLETLSEIVMSITIGGRMFKIPGHERGLRRMWRHSIAAGFYAKEIARMRRNNVEAAFLCGLLHDLGKPVLLTALVDWQKHTNTTLPMVAIEAAMEEFHATVGHTLATRWKMPDQVCAAILHHHEPTAAPQQVESVMLTCLADLLSYLTVSGSIGLDESVVTEHPVLERLNLYPEDVAALLAKKKQVAELTEVFLG